MFMSGGPPSSIQACAQAVQFIARLAVLALTAQAASAQSLVLTNGVTTVGALTNTTVILSNRCELRVTATNSPFPGSVIHLNSADAFLVLPNLRPSTVVASYLSQVRVNGAVALADSNCRVTEYGQGAIVLPHAPAFQPLQVFSGPHFTGATASLAQHVYYKGTGLGTLNAAISSFKLKRGYAATLAQNENGSGQSRNYVAADGDVEISLLPDALDDNIRFVYVTPWRWVDKKGACDASPTDLKASWWYNWNINQSSSRDLQYVAIRQQPFWPSLSQNWQTLGVNQLLGYNEPNNSVEDAYQNLTPPGSVSDAVARWPDLLATGLRVGAPAVTDGGYSWIVDFVNQADAAGQRVDFVPVHYYRSYPNNSYPEGAASNLYNYLKSIYDAVKRPLWVTEFNNGANWTTDADPTYDQNRNVIEAMIAMMDDTPWIERYAIYSRVEYMRQTHYDEGGLTPMGVMYRDHAAPLAYLQGLPGNGTRSFAQLRFETNALDSSGYANNGVTAGSPAYTNGVRGQALVFDGANTIVTLPPNVATGSAFTFAGWIRWNGGGNWQRIFDFGNSTSHYLFLTPSSGSGTLRFALKNGGSEQIVQTSPLAVGVWQHIAVTISGSAARLYVNGTLAASNTSLTITPASFSPRVNFLGKSQFIADPLFNGLMDEVLITDYALTAAQIASLQTNAPPQFTNSILARASATGAVAYASSIASTATDPDAGDVLSYSKTAGPAWLSVAANGTLSGTPTSGDGGTNYFTVRVTDSSGQNAFALLTVPVTVLTASGTWINDGSGPWSDANRWSGGLIASGPGETADFSTINLTGNRIVTLDTSRKIGTLKFGDTSGSQTWTIASSGGSTLTLDSASAASPSIVVTNTATLTAPVGGTNGFTKTGPGTLILAANNPLSGTLYLDRGADGSALNDGAVRVTAAQALVNVGQVVIRNTSVTTGGGRLELDGSAGGVQVAADLVTSMRNNTTGNLRNVAGNNTFTGDIFASTGGSNVVFQSDAGTLTLGGTMQYVGSSASGRSFNFLGAGNLLVTGDLLNSTNGAPIALAKSGTGTLTLAGVNTHTNTTSIRGGTLLVNGVITASPVTIGDVSTLGGTGVISGPVTVQSGGTLAPGASVGQLTVSNTVTLQAGSITRIELDKAASTSDQLRVTGMLNYGGSLTVTNLGGTLWAGDSFQIFSAPGTSGFFTATNLPALPAGFNWNWSPASGTLSISSSVALEPANVTANFTGGALELSWPSNHIGWRVETNATYLANASAWFPLAGSSATNRVFLPPNSTSSNVFFRLTFP